jgi:hypothetical protein
VKWLIDIKRTAILSRKTKVPIVTQTGLTVLAIAAAYGHVDIIMYLVHEKKCSITEIKDIIHLQRALHAVLQVNLFYYCRLSTY